MFKKFFLCFFVLLFWAEPGFAEEMAFIPKGPFQMGSVDGDREERPVHIVYVDGFHMDRYPVTNGDYARFLNANGNRVEGGKKWLDTEHPLSWWLCKIKEENGRFFPRSGFANHPVVKVSWYGAVAYARWVGKRLPTEAEWEKAARGGLIGKKYPWGDIITPDLANIKGWQASTPVGSYPPNPLGLYDLVGNVWQWCLDWYDPEYYAASPFINPKGPEQGSLKVLRGGSWYHQDSWRVSIRAADSPDSHQFCFVTGFRCVKDVLRNESSGEKVSKEKVRRVTRAF